ncbi:thioesterase [Acidihalobacter prosperus]|uniref:Thioesterase n=1 Tax=Acidihalobacter prosperus TaxID=160660 RepID=A0A1A6C1L0_9GAMM|nr:thioesterase [Acidihalobacter prosperus]
MTPEGGRFELSLTVSPADIDALGHVNNVVYLRWVQDAAIAHWRVVATPELRATLLWVVLRHEIDYKRPAYEGETLRVQTWVSEALRRRFVRHTEFLRAEDGRLLVRARTLWCPVDRHTRKAVATGPEVRACLLKPMPTMPEQED